MSDSEDEKSSLSEVSVDQSDADVRDLITQVDANGNSTPVKNTNDSSSKSKSKESMTSLMCQLFCCYPVDCSLLTSINGYSVVVILHFAL